MNRQVSVLILAVMAGCGKTGPVAPEASAPEPPVESLTNWTTKTELFVEYPPLAAGQTSRFAIHLTRLDNFKPLTSGRVEVRLAPENGEPQMFSAAAPSRPGIFGVDVKPSANGEYRLAIHVEAEGMSDRHDLGGVLTSAAKAESSPEHDPDTGEKIAFLKEQQWTLDFGTIVAEDRRLQAGLRVPAEVIPRSGGAASVTVPFDGRLIVEQLPVIGARVVQGQILASLLPPASAPSDLAALELARSEAEAAFQLALKDRQRAERLVAAGAAAAKRLDEARTREVIAAARLQASGTRLAQYEGASAAGSDPHGARLFALRAPISGFITETYAAPGANVKSGDTLFRIVDLDRVYVSAIVPEADLPRVKGLQAAEMEAPGLSRPRRLTGLISVGRVVDLASRTFPVIYEFDNRDRAVAVNQAVQVRLLTATASAGPAVPESAIVDDGGRPVIFVQEAGETFVRRPVRLGTREGGYVHVLEGVAPGERVVSRGAHWIRLAAMSSQMPAHGHVH